MFKSLSDKLVITAKRISGLGKLTDSNIKKTLKDVRLALLEADVALVVVKEFISKARKRALGSEVAKSVSPGQAMMSIVETELVDLMGKEREELNLKADPPVVILLAGLQGSGKTTSCAKLAKWLTTVKKKKVMLVSTDVYRPAAQEQLQILAKEIEVDYFASDSKKPKSIVKDALKSARKKFTEVLLIDTAGRLHVDKNMMQEIKDLHKLTSPTETLFVIDSMLGQDAVNSAKAFNEALPLTGIILTKIDGDARGGAALSVRHITQKPIKFFGTGEKVDAFEEFHPARIVQRILGMGDMQSLMDDVKTKLDKSKTRRLVKKIKKGHKFDLEDFGEQIDQMMKMGGTASILSKFPGGGKMAQMMKDKVGDKDLIRHRAIISSATKKERRNPDIINYSRKVRIAKGAGLVDKEGKPRVEEVNKLLKKHKHTQKFVSKMRDKNAMMSMMQNLKGFMG